MFGIQNLQDSVLEDGTNKPCWPDGLRVHLSSDFQAVEQLHITDGIGQDLSWSHGGHLSAGLGQVTVHPQPWLETHRKKNIKETVTN